MHAGCFLVDRCFSGQKHRPVCGGCSLVVRVLGEWPDDALEVVKDLCLVAGFVDEFENLVVGVAVGKVVVPVVGGCLQCECAAQLCTVNTDVFG